MILLTAGNKYLDIDAYASGIAYAKLLKAKGIDCKFISSAKTNISIPKIVKDLKFEIETKYETNKNDKFIIVDVSNPDLFDKFVDSNRIFEIVDHHTDFEQFWCEKNIPRQIDFVGSVATMIYEKFVQNNLLFLLDENLCKLLICAILDNTLNLKASITSQRGI